MARDIQVGDKVQFKFGGLVTAFRSSYLTPYFDIPIGAVGVVQECREHLSSKVYDVKLLDDTIVYGINSNGIELLENL